MLHGNHYGEKRMNRTGSKKVVAMVRNLLLALFSVAPPGAALASELRPPPRLPLEPPQLTLTAANVEPMETREMAITARVDGLYAVVETTLRFYNPNPQMLEGELRFPLPDGAAVSGYALDIDGVLVDGVVVTKERARVAFESETRRQIDPGLVEHLQGNLYRTRIYPLPPQGERRIRLTYVTPLAMAANGDAALHLPLPRQPLARLAVKMEVSAPDAAPPQLGGLGDQRFTQAEQVWRVETVQEQVTPEQDIVVALPMLPPQLAVVERDAKGDAWFMVSAVVPERKPAAAHELATLHVLWDASGSRADADLSAELALLGQLRAQRLRLTLFRDTPEASREFRSAAELVAAIRAAPFDGGTDLAALAAALASEPPAERTLLFSDGFDTLSGQPLEFTMPLLAVVSQSLADREALRQAAGGSLLDLQRLTPAQALAEIETPTQRVVALEGSGVAQVQGVGQVARGRVQLLGQLLAPEATLRIVYADGSRSEPFILRGAEGRAGTVLATAWAAARVQQLAPRAERFEEELLALGRRYGVVSPATSLLVLESLEQWLRHEIEPPATLPAMRDRWLQAMKNRQQQQGDPLAQRLERVVALWHERVAWWERDFSQATALPTTPAALHGERESMEQQARVMAPSRAASGVVAESARLGAVEEELAGNAVAGSVARFSAADELDGDGVYAAPLSLDSAPTAQAQGGAEERGAAAVIQVRAWSPETPYLKPLRAAVPKERYAAYLAQRPEWASSPGFFLDVAELLLESGERALALRVLSNLAELRIEDPALLRVLAWRLRQAGELERATVILRRVARLRPEEPQSFRDLALVLAERGQAGRSLAELEEAMQLLRRVALEPWLRHGDTIALFALEELNALVTWVERQPWKGEARPEIPVYDERLRRTLDSDIRVVMTWDADATDIDLHVVEPGGEEAYYGRNRTRRGGLVTPDVTDGYGPEAYLIRVAPHGEYTLLANYFGSSQQTLVGPATVSATIFTHWGRANEQRQSLTLRLDRPRDKVEVGRITFGPPSVAAGLSALRPGMSRAEVAALLGEPVAGEQWRYHDGKRELLFFFDRSGALLRVVERLPGGGEMVVVQ